MFTCLSVLVMRVGVPAVFRTVCGAAASLRRTNTRRVFERHHLSSAVREGSVDVVSSHLFHVRQPQSAALRLVAGDFGVHSNEQTTSTSIFCDDVIIFGDDQN